MKRVILLITILAAVICPAQQKPKSAPAKSAPTKPAPDTQTFRDTTYGIRYKLPAGWVDRTKDIQQGNDSSIAEVFLAIFERPPEVVGDTVNSAVIIAREDATTVPGLKAAAQYIDPLNKILTSQGFKSNGEASTLEINARELVRADFVKPRTEKLNMHQSTLVLLQKGQIVTFTFIAGSEEDVEELIQGLSFVPASRAR